MCIDYKCATIQNVSLKSPTPFNTNTIVTNWETPSQGTIELILDRNNGDSARKPFVEEKQFELRM
jgi:hypothetical protein